MLLLTNNKTLERVVSNIQKEYEYVYELKVSGKFNDEKLLSIRRGAVIKGVKMGPFFVSLQVPSKAPSNEQYGHTDKE